MAKIMTPAEVFRVKVSDKPFNLIQEREAWTRCRGEGACGNLTVREDGAGQKPAKLEIIVEICTGVTE